jgi:hypothetical protein
MQRRKLTPTSFSFLDIMFCGFGAVVLLVMILNGNVLKKREQNSEDLRAELKRVTALEEFAQNYLNQLNKKVITAELQQGKLQLQTNKLEKKVNTVSKKAKQEKTKAQKIKKSITTIQAQTAALENTTRLLRTKSSHKWNAGKRPVGFSGDGKRQYLTGLKLGGNRTLILLDSSASMLDEIIVNVIRRKLMNPATRKNAPKWQRALRSLHWLIANLRPGKRFQIYQFNTKAQALVAGTQGKWLSTDNTKVLSAALSASRQLAPLGGTSLHQAFEAAKQLSPKPDSIILLTDGLPTQGKYTANFGLVSAGERVTFFEQSIKEIPKGIPVNTLLFPMEGDPSAAGAFWSLAILTRGSFITPSRDWP